MGRGDAQGSEMKIDALDHPKTVALAAELGICIPQAIGHLELLWTFAAQKTPQGNIGKWPDAVISHAAQWKDSPSEFVDAMILVKYFDRHKEHRLLLHDWADHIPNWVRAKLSKLKLDIYLSEDLSEDLSGHYKCSVVKCSEEKGRKTLIPKDFHLSDELIKYAKSKGVEDLKYLEDYTEGFVLQCQTKGYKYVSFNSAWKKWFPDHLKKNPASTVNRIPKDQFV